MIGSYFMANGFGQGYFGIQVNSASERRILFSVWSPFSTNNPREIPDDQRITLLKKGEPVHAGNHRLRFTRSLSGMVAIARRTNAAIERE